MTGIDLDRAGRDANVGFAISNRGALWLRVDWYNPGFWRNDRRAGRKQEEEGCPERASEYGFPGPRLTVGLHPTDESNRSDGAYKSPSAAAQCIPPNADIAGPRG
jgi:hypothetical protein